MAGLIKALKKLRFTQNVDRHLCKDQVASWQCRVRDQWYYNSFWNTVKVQKCLARGCGYLQKLEMRLATASEYISFQILNDYAV